MIDAAGRLSRAEHNAARYLRVEWHDGETPQRGFQYPAGWYVVRTCPCHLGTPVTLPHPTREQAEHAMAAMLRVSGGDR
jgi:hypothetical protein